jgi:hypothetical protein
MDSLGEISKKLTPDAETEKEKEKDKEEEKKNEDAVSKELEEEAPAGSGDRARAAKDSVYLADSYQLTVALAEIVSPGLHIVAFDQAKDPKKTFADICGLRRKALLLGNNDAATNGIIESVAGRTMTADSLGKLGCREVRTMFHAVATIKREKNNSSREAVHAMGTGDAKRPLTIADINKKNAEFYK